MLREKGGEGEWGEGERVQSPSICTSYFLDGDLTDRLFPLELKVSTLGEGHDCISLATEPSQSLAHWSPSLRSSLCQQF